MEKLNFIMLAEYDYKKPVHFIFFLLRGGATKAVKPLHCDGGLI